MAKFQPTSLDPSSFGSAVFSMENGSHVFFPFTQPLANQSNFLSAPSLEAANFRMSSWDLGSCAANWLHGNARILSEGG